MSSVQDLNEKCPAFQGGCPFASKDQSNSQVFTEGCPFKGTKDTTELSSKLSDYVNSQITLQTIKDIFAQVHKRAVGLRQEIGAPCPVFSEACPFKTLTSHGQPLVDELEARQWFSEAAGAVPDNGAAQTLSKRFKYGTKDAHQRAETVHFIKEFLKGKVGREPYTLMLAGLLHVYQALESSLNETAQSAVWKSLHFPTELSRVNAIKVDLEYFIGADWEKDPRVTTVSPATQSYVSRILDCAKNSPDLLLAHSYTRYMGDLSGGQTLKRVARKAMALPPNAGTTFFDFENVPDGREFKKIFRSTLDALLVNESLADALVGEANQAFELNMGLFRELDVVMGFETVSPVALPAPHPVTTKGGTCPFSVMGQKREQTKQQGVAGNESGRVVWGLLIALFVCVLAILLYQETDW